MHVCVSTIFGYHWHVFWIYVILFVYYFPESSYVGCNIPNKHVHEEVQKNQHEWDYGTHQLVGFNALAACPKTHASSQEGNQVQDYDKQQASFHKPDGPSL